MIFGVDFDDCDPDLCCPYCDRHTTPHKGCVLR